MPKYKGDPPGPTTTIYMNIKDETMERVKKAQKEGIQKEYSQAAFLGYLIDLGINVYEKHILTAERGEVDLPSLKSQ